MMNLPAMNGDSFNNAFWYLTSSIEERVPLADIGSGLYSCQLSLIGNVLSDKPVYKRWEREKALMDIQAFYRVPLWVQPWGLPVHCHTEEMGDRIGSRPGTVLKVA
ncbi:hypothetical protein D5086_022851 [Populus alba]|uniref:Uncharacterized protein n=2 Tax=Populus TaxID=3689 RepID=A0ACC4B8S8_POPAL|nr:hypothetical protein NC653_028712 [Populus alba x Populus x berolinensis]